MTREQFSELARKASQYATAHPCLYRVRVAVWAALGYGVLFGIMLVAVSVIIGIGRSLTYPWFWESVGREPRIAILAAGFIIAMASLLFSLVRSVFMRWPVPTGWRVHRQEAPKLFALIDEVVAASVARPPSAVLFTPDFNAGINQRPRFGWFGPTRDYLVIGLPLMAGLTPEEFKAVIAHEFAHLRGRHGRFGNWIWKLRVIWQGLGERFLREGRRVGLLLTKFGQWYAPRFNAYSFALAREHEFEADLWSARISGAESAAKALVKIALLTQRLEEEFWQHINDRARSESEPPPGVFAGLLGTLRAPSTAEQRRRWLRAVLAAETEGADSHPATIERLQRLGCSFASALDASEAIEAFAREATSSIHATDVFLEKQHVAEIIAGLESNWRVIASPSWRARFEQTQQMLARIRQLDAKAAATAASLDEREAWESTFLKVQLAKDKTGRRVELQDFISQWPEHAVAHYTLGCELLTMDESSGMESIERAIALDARLAAEGEGLIAAFLRRTGRWEEATTRKLEAVRKADMLDAGRAERMRISRKDTFLPHGLSEASIAALREQLQRHPRVAKAWLARKQLVHLPEHPWHVLVCVVRWRWYEFTTQKKLLLVLRQLALDLQIDGQKDFSVFAHTNRGRIPPIGKAVRRVKGSEIYFPSRRRGKAPETPADRSARSTSASSPAPMPPLPPMSNVPTARQPFAWSAVVASLVILGLPLAYVGLQIKRSMPLWKLASAPRANIRHVTAAKEADARKPIVLNPRSSRAEVEKQHALAWAQRVMSIQRYGNRTPQNTPWFGAAAEFISKALPRWAGVHGAPGAESLLPPADDLVRNGCDDPVVLFLAGKLKFDTDAQSAEAAVLFNRALQSFSQANYPAAVARLAAEAFVADCERRNDGTGQSRSAKKLWLKYFTQQLGDGSFLPDEQSVLAQQLSQGKAKELFSDNAEHCLDLLQKPAASSLASWLRMFLLGKAHIESAWHARGQDYASAVTSEGWKEFFAHLKEARHNLVASWTANPQRPEAAAAMIAVAMAEKNTPPGESERLWFDRAVAAEFDYLPAYRHFAWALRPRWNGSVHAMLDFGLQCLQTQQYETAVPLEFYYAVCFVRQEYDGNTAVFRDPRIAALLDEMFRNYQDEHGDEELRVCAQRRHAYAASLVGNFDLAYNLLRPLRFQLDPEIVGALDDGDTADAFLERIAAFGGPAGAQISRADQLVVEGKIDDALALYRGALVEAQAESRAQRYIRSRIAVLELKRSLDAGAWVSFQPKSDSKLAGWSAILGSWTANADGSLIARSGANGFLLVNDTDIGPDFELRGEMEFLPGSSGEVQAGIAFGHPAWDTYDWRSIRLRRQPDQRSEVTLAQHWQAGPVRSAATAESNVFLLQSWRGKVTFVLNGQPMFRDEAFPGGFVRAANSRVGLGAYAHHGNVFSVRYRNVQLRRLVTKPASADSEILRASNTP